MNHYQDRTLLVDEHGITITSYAWPGHHRHIPFSSIVAVEEIPLGTFSGRYRLVGFELRRLRDFFPWDTHRSATSRAFALDVGRRVRPVISPQDPEQVLKLIAERTHGRSKATSI
ncbi:MAG: hypothetical protein ACR2QO_10470 [Acidimicrobiales bacterium]